MFLYSYDKSFPVFLLCGKVMNLLILMSMLSFLSAFLHSDKTYLSKFKSLSIRTPKSVVVCSPKSLLLQHLQATFHICAHQAEYDIYNDSTLYSYVNLSHSIARAASFSTWKVTSPA